jgi:hypothetical protein
MSAEAPPPFRSRWQDWTPPLEFWEVPYPLTRETLKT